LKVVVFFV